MELLFLKVFLILECLIYQGSCTNQGTPSNVRLLRKKQKEKKKEDSMKWFGAEASKRRSYKSVNFI